MDIRNLIEASATVITIAKVKPGDVYKRIAGEAYGIDKPLVFGVVQSVMNNGTESAFSAIELNPNYLSVEITEKVFSSGGEVALFPATPAEVELHFHRVSEALEQRIKTKRDELSKAMDARDMADDVMAMVLDRTLTAPETVEGSTTTPEIEA